MRTPSPRALGVWNNTDKSLPDGLINGGITLNFSGAGCVALCLTTEAEGLGNRSMYEATEKCCCSHFTSPCIMSPMISWNILLVVFSYMLDSLISLCSSQGQGQGQGQHKGEEACSLGPQHSAWHTRYSEKFLERVKENRKCFTSDETRGREETLMVSGSPEYDYKWRVYCWGKGVSPPFPDLGEEAPGPNQDSSTHSSLQTSPKALSII